MCISVAGVLGRREAGGAPQLKSLAGDFDISVCYSLNSWPAFWHFMKHLGRRFGHVASQFLLHCKSLAGVLAPSPAFWHVSFAVVFAVRRLRCCRPSLLVLRQRFWRCCFLLCFCSGTPHVIIHPSPPPPPLLLLLILLIILTSSFSSSSSIPPSPRPPSSSSSALSMCSVTSRKIIIHAGDRSWVGLVSRLESFASLFASQF